MDLKLLQWSLWYQFSKIAKFWNNFKVFFLIIFEKSLHRSVASPAWVVRPLPWHRLQGSQQEGGRHGRGTLSGIAVHNSHFRHIHRTTTCAHPASSVHRTRDDMGRASICQFYLVFLLHILSCFCMGTGWSTSPPSCTDIFPMTFCILGIFSSSNIYPHEPTSSLLWG